MKTTVIIQARLSSERLHKKILSPLNNSTMLEQIVRRCKVSKRADEVVVACPTQDVEPIFNATGIAAIGGPEVDVLSRLLIAAASTKADRIVRVTADCPLVCGQMIDMMLDQHSYCMKPVVVNTIGHTFPDGMDLEVYSVEWLKDLATIIPPDWREYFAQYVCENYTPKVVERVIYPENLGKAIRLTVDYHEDLELVTRIYDAMGKYIWAFRTIVEWLIDRPHLLKINAHRIDGNFGRRSNNSNLLGE